MGRAATAAEVQKVMAELAAIEADSAHADDKMTVSCHPPTHALVVEPHLSSLYKGKNGDSAHVDGTLGVESPSISARLSASPITYTCRARTG